MTPFSFKDLFVFVWGCLPFGRKKSDDFSDGKRTSLLHSPPGRSIRGSITASLLIPLLLIFFFLRLYCMSSVKVYGMSFGHTHRNYMQNNGETGEYNHKLQLNAQFHIMDSSSITFDSFSAEWKLEFHYTMTQWVKLCHIGQSDHDMFNVLEPYMSRKLQQTSAVTSCLSTCRPRYR